MKKILILITALCLSSCAIGAGENSKIVGEGSGFFPQVAGIDLEGNKRQLPQSFDKNINLVVVAFKREQQEQVDGWIKVADNISQKNPEVSFYEIPLINKRNPISRSFINNGMHRGILDTKARKRTITVYTDRDEFFEMMKMKEERIYLLVVSKEGKIMQRIEGEATKDNISLLMKRWLF